MAGLTPDRLVQALRAVSPCGDLTEQYIDEQTIEFLIQAAVMHLFAEQIPENDDTAVIRQVLKNIRAASPFAKPDYFACSEAIYRPGHQDIR